VFLPSLLQLSKVKNTLSLFVGDSLAFLLHRHESYSHQFRAMFVTNCQVNKKERYRYDAKDDAPAEGYYVVKCETCDTHVAMMDEEEVYHFFNVIAN
jgi:hypothetical protein